MNDSPEPPSDGEERPPRFQYSLKTLMIVVTACAVVASLTATFGNWVLELLEDRLVWFTIASITVVVSGCVGYFGVGRPWKRDPPRWLEVASPFAFVVAAFLATPVLIPVLDMVVYYRRDILCQGDILLALSLLALGGVIRQWRRLSPRQQCVSALTYVFSVPTLWFLAIFVFGWSWHWHQGWYWDEPYTEILGNTWGFAFRGKTTIGMGIRLFVILVPATIGSLSISRFLRYGMYASAIGMLLFWATILSGFMATYWYWPRGITLFF